MSTKYQQNNNININNNENKNDILKTKIIILILIGIFSIIFGCLPIFFDRILIIKEYFLRIFKIFKKSNKFKDNDLSASTATTTAATAAAVLPSTSSINKNQYFINNNIKSSSSLSSLGSTSIAAVNQKLKTHSNFHQLIKFLLCFGGGVLFFTSFIHLHPEIREIFKNLEKRNIFTNTIDGMGGIQTSELLICCGFFLIYLLEELMHYLIAIREMRNNSELVLHRALTKCNPVIFWKKNRNLNNCDQQENEAIKKRKNDDRHDFLDTYECHFGFDPETITMDEFSNNCRRDSLPMECPLSSLTSSNYGDQSQMHSSTINTNSMSYIHMQGRNGIGIQEYGISHPLSGSSTTLLMETSVPPVPPPPQIDYENFNYFPNTNNMKNLNDNDNNILKQNRTNNKCVTFSIDQNNPNDNFQYNNNNLRRKSFDNNYKITNNNLPFQINSNNNNGVDDDINNKSSNLQTILRGLVAIFALSIHSLFEGLAVGLEKNISSIWYLFLAIGTHKFVIIFCVGIELVAAKLKPLWITIYIIGFAMVTPFGILIGSLISHSYETTNNNEIFHNTEITSEGVLLTVAAMLQAISAGTLLYVIFFEILIKERHHHHHFEAVTSNNNNSRNSSSNVHGHLHHSAESLIQCFAVGCGFMFMVAIHALISKHPHGHVH